MPILTKIARFAAITLALLFIIMSLGGVIAAWFVSQMAGDVALKAFGVIEAGVGIIDSGVGRVDGLVAASRTEVRQAAETITAIGGQAAANSPVLTALNERLDANLAPRIAQMRQTLGPVRDALGNVANAVALVSSLPGMSDRAPRLAALDETFDRLESLSAGSAQLRSTLSALVSSQTAGVAPETVAAMNRLTQRIDTRLGEVQTKVQSVRSNIDALQVRLEKRKSRLLLFFNLVAVLSTFMVAWVIYTQVVVLRAPLGFAPQNAARLVLLNTAF